MYYVHIHIHIHNAKRRERACLLHVPYSAYRVYICVRSCRFPDWREIGISHVTYKGGGP